MGRTVDVDELMSADEVAALIGWKSGRVLSVMRSRYPDFPAPVVDRPRCQLWARADIERWAKATGRLTT